MTVRRCRLPSLIFSTPTRGELTSTEWILDASFAFTMKPTPPTRPSAAPMCSSLPLSSPCFHFECRSSSPCVSLRPTMSNLILSRASISSQVRYPFGFRGSVPPTALCPQLNVAKRSLFEQHRLSFILSSSSSTPAGRSAARPLAAVASKLSLLAFVAGNTHTRLARPRAEPARCCDDDRHAGDPVRRSFARKFVALDLG